MYALGELLEKMTSAVVDERVRRVEPQAATDPKAKGTSKKKQKVVVTFTATADLARGQTS